MAEDPVVVQSDLVRFGLGIYAELDDLKDGDEITDSVVANALENGALTGMALDEMTAVLAAGPSALATQLTATIQQAIEDIGTGISTVFHGTDPNFPRPPVDHRVDWFGSVRPINAEGGDIVSYVDAEAVEPPDIDWFLDLDASTLALADLALVSSWTDVSGNGRHAVQATSANQPIFHAGSVTDAYVRFDGVNDRLLTTAFASPLAQDFTVVMAVRWVAVPTDTLGDSIISSSTSGFLIQARIASAVDRLQVFAGNTLTHSGVTLVNNQWYIISVHVSGSTTTVRINGQVVSGNVGAAALDALVIGSNGSGTGTSSIDVNAIKIIAGVLAELGDVEQALADRVGVTLP